MLVDFSASLLIVAFVSLFAPLVSASLETNAGSAVSGHRLPKKG